MATTTETARQRLASHLLGESVQGWCTRLRGRGASPSEIARQLDEATAGQVSVTDESIRLWLRSWGIR